MSQNEIKGAFVCIMNPFLGRQNQTHCQNCDTTSSVPVLACLRRGGKRGGWWEIELRGTGRRALSQHPWPRPAPFCGRPGNRAAGVPASAWRTRAFIVLSWVSHWAASQTKQDWKSTTLLPRPREHARTISTEKRPWESADPSPSASLTSSAPALLELRL